MAASSSSGSGPAPSVSVKPGQIMFLEELAASPAQHVGASLRVLGTYAMSPSIVVSEPWVC